MNLVRQLRQQLEQRFHEQFQLDVGAEQTALLTVVDESFAGKGAAQRRLDIEPLLTGAGLRVGMLELYTPEEAKANGVYLNPAPSLAPANWDDAIAMLEAGQNLARPRERTRKPHRIVFYSYKGGVGRTTALAHTAFHLARSGSRVVVVDMDVEAPGLHTVLPRPDGQPITCGLVDYLWERQVRPFDPETGEGLETCLVALKPGTQKAIAYAVQDPLSRTKIHVIPAGMVGHDFVRRLHTLSYRDVATRTDDAWALFEKELVDQLEPDILLIDARTGLGDWGGLSLLRLADEAFLVVYPSEQNMEGLQLVRETIKELTGIKTHLVLSPVPEGIIGKELIERFLPTIQGRQVPHVPIYYNPNVAAADHYPVDSAMPNYAKLADLIRDGEISAKLASAMQQVDYPAMLASFAFPDADALPDNADQFARLFQKTADFDNLFDDACWVIRGHEQAGKSTLFRLLVDYRSVANQYTNDKLAAVLILSGHGPSHSSALQIDASAFAHLAQAAGDTDFWRAIWQAYAVLRIASSEHGQLFQPILHGQDMAALASCLATLGTSPPAGVWQDSHTSTLLQLASLPLRDLCKNYLLAAEDTLVRSRQTLWLLYDELEHGLALDGRSHNAALSGLLQFIYQANQQGLAAIQCKVFLDENRWQILAARGKTHFGAPRTILLQWKFVDFLRLAWRICSASSQAFHALLLQNLPTAGFDPDSANAEQLCQALAPLWGLHLDGDENAFIADWLYLQMQESAARFSPLALTKLLRHACQAGQTQGGRSTQPCLLSRAALDAGLAMTRQAKGIENNATQNTQKAIFSGRQIVKIFLASSAELREERDALELHLRQLNDDLQEENRYLQVVRWENFLDAVSSTSKQDDYNVAIRDCDIFLSLFATKTGKYTAEEFNVAHQQFLATKRPWIFTFFRETDLNSASVNRGDMQSLWAFQDKLKEIGHFWTNYKNTADLHLQVLRQLKHYFAQTGQATSAPTAAPPNSGGYSTTIIGATIHGNVISAGNSRG
jgi:cellulose biosynthesis protein BcsQ